MQLIIGCFIIVFLSGCERASPSVSIERSSPSQSISSSQRESSSEGEEFEDIQGGRGKTEDGIPFSYHLYKSFDGVAVTTTVEDRGSAVQANKALQTKIKKAAQIIERGANLDNKGQRVGERIIAKFPTNGSEKEYTAVLWTEGSQFHYIESSSLQHVLRFEKRFYR